MAMTLWSAFSILVAIAAALLSPSLTSFTAAGIWFVVATLAAGFGGIERRLKSQHVEMCKVLGEMCRGQYEVHGQQPPDQNV